MKIEIEKSLYEVVIVKKKTTKNTYIRVKENQQIYVTTNYFTSDKYIYNLINENIDNIKKMIHKSIKKEEKKQYFYYLGKRYDIIKMNNKDVILGHDKVFLNPTFDVDKWYKQRANIIFKETLDKVYKKILFDIPYPTLTIRKMKTRWGVCNVKTKKITLNLELIKKDIIYLEYVIVHELSHLLYPNHSKDFWNCVSVNMPNYKKIRKELKQDE